MLLQTVQPMPGLDWIDLIGRGGSFAVLVYLVVWGLPQLLKAISDERTERAKERKEAADERAANRKEDAEERLRDQERFMVELGELRKDQREALVAYRTEITAERLACEKHFQTLAEAMARGNQTTTETIRSMIAQGERHREANIRQTDLLEQMLRKDQGGTV